MQDFREWSGAGQGAVPLGAEGETIFAPATGAGVAGVAILRISGPQAVRCLEALTDAPLPPPRLASLRRILDSDGSPIDHALVLRFEAGASYTGDPVVELHCHGGPAIMRRLLERVGALNGCRIAEPGEFTRRAFENGLIDLAGIEALGDLLHAETELQRRQAMRNFGGAVHRRAAAWREKLLRALAIVEVTIDWVDEDVPEEVGPEIAAIVGDIVAELDRELSLSQGAERLRTGFEVALVGAPNVGKSSLLNHLSGREAALTSPLPGTTRDVIELRYDLRGIPVIFLDMAGIRETTDPLEAAGVARAVERARAADLRIFLSTRDSPPVAWAEREPDDIDLWTKADLFPGAGGLAVSVADGAGVDCLTDAIGHALSSRIEGSGLIAHARQRAALRNALSQLQACDALMEPELLAARLRGALGDLSVLIGAAGVEDILDRVFAGFCLGK